MRVSRHVVVSTDASAMGWGAMAMGMQLRALDRALAAWHINCLELLAV